jgi:hypothetical protein
MASYLSADFSESLTGGVGTALYRAPGRAKPTEGTGPGTVLGTGHSLDSPSHSESMKKSLMPHAKGGRTYDAKADMFSLGIIMFEMCHEPFSTGMERVKTLCALRGPESIVPSYFSDKVPENLVNIIKWIVETDPSKRPSAAELQASPLMPPRIQLDKSYLEEVMNSLTVPNSDIGRRVVTALFNRKEASPLLAEHEDVTFDIEAMSGTLRALKLDYPWSNPSSTMVGPTTNSTGKNTHSLRKIQSFPDSTDNMTESMMMLPSQVLHSMVRITEDVFLGHGGSVLNPSLMHPRYYGENSAQGDRQRGIGLHCTSTSSWHPTQKKQDILDAKIAPAVIEYQPVELMDRAGTVVTLPSELVTGYARYVARLGVTNATRYLVESVYRERVRKDAASGQMSLQHPQQSIEAVFDIVRENEGHHIRSTSALQDTDFAKHVGDAEKRAFVEAEVIIAAVEVANAIDPKNAVGQRFLRIGDSRLGNAILDLCAAPFPREKILRILSTIADEAITSNIIGTKNRAVAMTDSALVAQAHALLNAVGLPNEVRRALKPFVNILAVSTSARACITSIEKVRSVSSVYRASY